LKTSRDEEILIEDLERTWLST